MGGKMVQNYFIFHGISFIMTTKTSWYCLSYLQSRHFVTTEQNPVLQSEWMVLSRIPIRSYLIPSFSKSIWRTARTGEHIWKSNGLCCEQESCKDFTGDTDGHWDLL